MRANTVDALNKYANNRVLDSNASSQAEQQKESPPQSPNALSSLNPLSNSSDSNVRVLVADDQPLTRMYYPLFVFDYSKIPGRVISSMVAKAFPNVLIDTAENGELAVSKADTTRYNLILMGIHTFVCITIRF